MAFPTGWGRKCAVTIDADFVSGTTHADFPVLVTAAMLPSEMFDADGSYPALNGGGDIRFSSDSAGSTQLACEIVSFVTDNNPASGSAEIWVLVPTLSGSVDTTIYVWYNKSGESQPAVTDTYGRNAVWADYAAVYHGDDLTDSSGNGNTLTAHSSATGGATGKIGDCFGPLNGSSQYFSVSSPSGISSDPLTLSAWYKSDGDSGSGQHIASIDATVTGDFVRMAVQDNVAGNPLRCASFQSSPTFFNTADTSSASFLSWEYAVGAIDSNGACKIYINGGSLVSDSTNTLSTTGLNELEIGRRADSGTQYFDGELDEVRFRNSGEPSADWIATEYANQNAPATFASAGTPESVGGATVTLSNLTFASRTATSITPRLDVTVS